MKVFDVMAAVDGTSGATAFKDGCFFECSAYDAIGFKKTNGQKWNVGQALNGKLLYTEMIAKQSIETILLVLVGKYFQCKRFKAVFIGFKNLIFYFF